MQLQKQNTLSQSKQVQNSSSNSSNKAVAYIKIEIIQIDVTE